MTVETLTKNDLEANNKKLVDGINTSIGKKLEELEKRLENKIEELEKRLENKIDQKLQENNRILVTQIADMILKSPILEEKLERKVKETLQKAFS